MRILSVLTVSSVGLLASFSAQAQDAFARANVEAVALKDPNRMVCSFFYHEGSLIHRPMCKTAREWYADRERTRRDVVDIQLRKLQIGRY